jgi:alkyl sulfatase BDS1-like metallo-beta-lactamase superfamily hydrolase
MKEWKKSCVRFICITSINTYKTGQIMCYNSGHFNCSPRETLPFSDTRDFDENRKGFIAPMKQRQIPADAGHIAWDMDQFNFIDEQDAFDSVHPSLHRIAQLNQNYGLYEVTPGIYQVRGTDLAQITFIRGQTGWIAYDVMVSAETARASWKLFQEHVGEGLPISVVIFSHNHGDHWGGVRGLITDKDVASGRVEVIAPDGFMGHLVSESVFAGNAMNRRLCSTSTACCCRVTPTAT